ncbi:hypothetical protein [Spirosoma fluviale]|uniref:hypothetical protein n=1 Tax=Spirosoma fluviale TaxID=1597977 RepID=UPI001FE5D96D|nr:hypothetical protein [Spirosoma fluviale]
MLAIELFGAAVAPYAAVSCVISFLMSGHRSLYSSQLLAISKSRGLETQLGRKIKETSTVVRPIRLRYNSDCQPICKY